MFKLRLAQSNISNEAFEIIRHVLDRKLTERGCALGDKEGDYTVCTKLDNTLPQDSYKIETDDLGVTITADRLCNVFAGIGRFLTSVSFDGKGGFEAPHLSISHTQDKEIRGMYFATHFYNFYHVAPIEEVYCIIEDCAIRGCNIILLCPGVQHYISVDDPEAKVFYDRLKLMLKYSEKLGIAPSLMIMSNSAFANSPEELLAPWQMQGNYVRNIAGAIHNEICPSKPGGMEELIRQQCMLLNAFTDVKLKYLVYWAYDEGGCTCPDCEPWGTNGFVRIVNKMIPIIREYGFDAEIIVSAWHYEINYPGEWNLFYDLIKKGGLKDVPYVLTSFRSKKLPESVKEGGVPDNIRFIDFPEISMLGIQPWGGHGANPAGMVIDNLNNWNGHLYCGGIPYSEGIFEDTNKFAILSYFSGIYKDNTEALRDYIRFEFCINDKETEEKLVRALQLMECTLPRTFETSLEGGWRFAVKVPWPIEEIYRIITEIDEKLPEAIRKGWRWRLIYLRAVIDNELYHNEFIGLRSELCQKCFEEINKIQYTENALRPIRAPHGK